MLKNPFPLSEKYEELIQIYKYIAKNGCYYVNGTFAPPRKVFGKSGQIKFKELLNKYFSFYDIKTVLDYGGGQGSWDIKVAEIKLIDYLKLDKVVTFEPARDLTDKPLMDCVVSFDVLEHIFICDVPWVLYDIFSKANKLVIINVACYKASKLLTNGENVHSTQRPPFWWKGAIDMVGNFFPNISYVLIASNSSKDVVLYEPVSRSDYLKVPGFLALEK